MKNLLIYISPSGSFFNPSKGIVNDAPPLIKIQIENSFQLGWKKEDILLYTNFPFQYGVIKAKVLKDVEYFVHNPQASKINAIVELFKKGLIKKNELYWFHDLDAFQLQPLTEKELHLGTADMALTDYGRLPRWSTGSIFFKSGSKDIFESIKELVHKKNTDEERALGLLMDSNKNIQKRVKKLNKTYNFTILNLRANYKTAIKPLRVVHFHPTAELSRLGIKNPLAFFLGENNIHTPLLTQRLNKIFRVHRIG